MKQKIWVVGGGEGLQYKNLPKHRRLSRLTNIVLKNWNIYRRSFCCCIDLSLPPKNILSSQMKFFFSLQEIFHILRRCSCVTAILPQRMWHPKILCNLLICAIRVLLKIAAFKVFGISIYKYHYIRKKSFSFKIKKWLLFYTCKTILKNLYNT